MIQAKESAGTDWVNTVRSGGRAPWSSPPTATARSASGTRRRASGSGVVDLPPLDGQHGLSDLGRERRGHRRDDAHAGRSAVPHRPAARSVHPVTMQPRPDPPPFGVVGWTADGHVIVETGSLDDGILGVSHRGPRDRRGPLDPAGQVLPYEVTADPHGRWLATGGQDGKLRFVSMADGHLLAPAADRGRRPGLQRQRQPRRTVRVHVGCARPGEAVGHEHVP